MPDPFQTPSHSVLDAASNPFRPGIGRIPPAFGGREQSLGLAKIIVDRLAVATDPPFLLIRGFRGIGKTALMAYVRQQARSRHIRCVHLEADRGLTDPDGLIRQLLSTTGDMTDDSMLRRIVRRIDGVTVGADGIQVSLGATPTLGRSLEQAVAALGDVAADVGQGVLLTVDEIHEAEDELFRPLIRAMHAATQEGRPVGFIAAGLPGAAQALQEEGQTYTERLDTIELQLLDDDAVAEAISEPFGRGGIAVDADVIDAVIRDSGGYPYFVQLWGDALWVAATDPRAITLHALPAARERVTARTDQFYTERARRLPGGRGRTVAVALARLGGDASTADLLSEAGVDNAQYSPVRDALLSSGLAHSPTRGRIAFTVPGFDRWLDRNPTD